MADFILFAVPGIFGNRTDEWTDDYLTEKMQQCDTKPYPNRRLLLSPKR